MSTSAQPLEFYPVLHLVTGSPGMSRNGGIWRTIKSEIKKSIPKPKIMAQATHFSMYNISANIWDKWIVKEENVTLLSNEIRKTFGDSSELFIDSGGFQLLYGNNIDLKKWKIDLAQRDILELQIKYDPERLASLDYPLSPKMAPEIIAQSMRLSIDNATWLAQNFESFNLKSVPYLVIHGRNPEEIILYLDKLNQKVSFNWFKQNTVGLALGSQVPLSRYSSLILENIRTVDSWINRNIGSEIPLHILGVGEQIMGPASSMVDREMSFDNSTYVQKAYRFRIFNPLLNRYEILDPEHLPECDCMACKAMDDLGSDLVMRSLTGKSFKFIEHKGEKIYKSKILGLVAIHNAVYWRNRLTSSLKNKSQNSMKSKMELKTVKELPESFIAINFESKYSFPFNSFKANSPALIFLPCSKHRPYSESRIQRRMIEYLSNKGFEEGVHYDRITLSGLYGPVHWNNERDEHVMSYDFSLSNPLISEEHKQSLRYKTALVLNLVKNKYNKKIGYFPSKPYMGVFGEVVSNFGGVNFNDVEELAKVLEDNETPREGENNVT